MKSGDKCPNCGSDKLTEFVNKELFQDYFYCSYCLNAWVTPIKTADFINIDFRLTKDGGFIFIEKDKCHIKRRMLRPCEVIQREQLNARFAGRKVSIPSADSDMMAANDEFLDES